MNKDIEVQCCQCGKWFLEKELDAQPQEEYLCRHCSLWVELGKKEAELIKEGS